MARSSNGLGQYPFTVEMHGSNPARATRFIEYQRNTLDTHEMHLEYVETKIL